MRRGTAEAAECRRDNVVGLISSLDTEGSFLASLARSANLPTGLYILACVNFFFFSFILIYSEQSYLSIYLSLIHI